MHIQDNEARDQNSRRYEQETLRVPYLGVSKPVSDEAAEDETGDGQGRNESDEEVPLSGLYSRHGSVPTHERYVDPKDAKRIPVYIACYQSQSDGFDP
jgi:hypothetical protein